MYNWNQRVQYCIPHSKKTLLSTPNTRKVFLFFFFVVVVVRVVDVRMTKINVFCEKRLLILTCKVALRVVHEKKTSSDEEDVDKQNY